MFTVKGERSIVNGVSDRSFSEEVVGLLRQLVERPQVRRVDLDDQAGGRALVAVKLHLADGTGNLKKIGNCQMKFVKFATDQ